jgi:hypothetical protein
LPQAAPAGGVRPKNLAAKITERRLWLRKRRQPTPNHVYLTDSNRPLAIFARLQDVRPVQASNQSRI